MPKADNMLAILWLLKSRRKMTAAELSEQLEVHIRTVYRCIDALCVAGVPIVAETGRDGGYYIPDHFKLEPLFFDAAEQKALLQAATFARESGYPSEEALNRAIAKIKRYTNPEQLQRMEWQESQLEVIRPPAAPQLRPVLEMLESSIDLQVSVDLDYRSGYDGVASRRTIDLYGLVHWKDKWYAVGYCHLRQEVRSFRVDRMSAIARTDRQFRRPADFSAREFLLGSLVPEPESASDDRLVSVIIEGSRQALDDLCSHWLWSHVLVERTEQRAHFKLDEVRLYTQMPYQLLTYGGKIRIAAPAELKARMAEIAASLLQYYQS